MKWFTRRPMTEVEAINAELKRLHELVQIAHPDDGSATVVLKRIARLEDALLEHLKKEQP